MDEVYTIYMYLLNIHIIVLFSQFPVTLCQMFVLWRRRQLYIMFGYIDLDIKFDNNKYNQKLPHFKAMTKYMINNYFVS